MRFPLRVSQPVVATVLIVCVIAVSLTFGIWPIERSEGKWATINNTEYGFSVDYPTRWKAEVYGKNGYRGLDEIKLQIYRSVLAQFFITVRYQEKVSPTLDDVVNWRDRMIVLWNKALIQDGENPYEEIALINDTLNGHPIIRRQYSNGTLKIEDIYLARTNDMIIISLSAEERGFESYREDFETIIASFRPVN
jgi:hypothetical protein